MCTPPGSIAACVFHGPPSLRSLWCRLSGTFLGPSLRGQAAGTLRAASAPAASEEEQYRQYRDHLLRLAPPEVAGASSKEGCTAGSSAAGLGKAPGPTPLQRQGAKLNRALGMVSGRAAQQARQHSGLHAT